MASTISIPKDQDFILASTRVPRTLWHAVRLHCVKKDVTVSGFITALL